MNCQCDVALTSPVADAQGSLFIPMFQYSIRRFAPLLLCILCLFATKKTSAQNRSYTTISAVTVTPLSNGVQISIQADGILQYTNQDTYGLKMHLYFPGARNGTGKNFFNVNSYPVSYIQLSTPQGATNGIGLNLDISNLSATSASVSTSADSQSVLLTINSDRTVESGRKGGDSSTGIGAATTKPDTSTEVLYQNGLLTLRAVKADIHELIGGIARKSGISVAVDDAVSRKVSLNLNNVSAEDALRDISTAYGLALSQNDGVYTLSEGVPTDLATYNASDTQSFRMQNTQAQTASGLLPNFLYSYVKVNPEQNAVVVTAPSQMLAKIGQDLQKMDVAPPQIAVEAIAVELTDTNDRALGISFGNAQSGFSSATDTAGGTLSYTNIGNLPSNFQFTLNALELQGKARVRARPQMAVTNGQTANLFIGAQRFILTQYNQFGQTQTRIQSVDVGVKLAVTPLTGGNGEITTHIVPEVSNITELDIQTGLPVLSSRRADTTVRVKDGETIAIGGLTLDQEQTTKSKVPFFGDLPLIGGLFRGSKKNTVRTELVIFITPHILTTADTTNTNAPTPTSSTGNAMKNGK